MIRRIATTSLVLGTFAIPVIAQSYNGTDSPTSANTSEQPSVTQPDKYSESDFKEPTNTPSYTPEEPSLRDDRYEEDSPRREREQNVITDVRTVISPLTPDIDPTAAITQRLRNVERICETMGDEYKVACFAVSYKDLARAIKQSNGDPEIGKTLSEAADKLDALVRSNLDSQKPPLRAHLDSPSGSRLITTAPMRAVKQAQTAEIQRKAANILEEAETVLLRSATSVGPTRSLSFQRVAAAIDSNKVLLRSS